MLVGLLLLTPLAGWRWHQAILFQPIRVIEGGGPTWLLVIQEGDCPVRRSAMLDWWKGTAGEGEESRDAKEEARLGVLGPRKEVLEPRLAALPTLSQREVARARRGLLRAGVRTTPALLLVNPEGFAVFGAPFLEDGLGSPFPWMEAGLRAGSDARLGKEFVCNDSGFLPQAEAEGS